MLSYSLMDLTWLGLLGQSSAGSSQQFNPLTIPNLKLWYKGDGQAGLVNNDTMSILVDSSGNNNSGSIQTAGRAIYYRTNVINGYPVIDFVQTQSNVNAYFDIKDFGQIVGTSSAEYIVVLKSKNDPAPLPFSLGPFYFMSGSNLATPTLPYTDGKLYDAFASTINNRSFAKPTPLSSSFRIYNVVNNTESMWSMYDGHTIYFDTASTPSNFGLSAPYRLGYSSTVGSANDYSWIGQIAEMFLYAPSVLESDRISLYEYLNTKYALSAPLVSTGSIAPTNYSSLNSWWKADSLALNHSDSISIWSSSYGTTHLSGSGATRPTYITGALNGNPVARFGVTSFLTASSLITLSNTGTFTIIIVGKYNADSIITAHGPSHNFQLRARQSDVNITSMYMNGAPQLYSATPFDGRSAGDYQTNVWRYSGSVGNIKQMPISVEVAGAVGNNTVYISQLGANPFVPLNGDIAEFIVYDRYFQNWELSELYKHYIYPKYKV